MTGYVGKENAGPGISKELHEKLMNHERVEKEGNVRTEMLFTEGMKLDIDGYLYVVDRLAGPLTVIKRLRPSDADSIDTRVLKKNDQFNIRVGLVTHNFKVISATGRSWFSIKRMLEKK